MKTILERDESPFLHHPMAGKQLSCLLISGWIGDLRVNPRVLDVLVAQVICHVLNALTCSAQKMC